MTIGFVGIGVMGLPMATQLLGAGQDLWVWNRTPERCETLRAAGATVANTLDELFDNVPIAILMLRDSAAMDEVLGRETSAFARRVRGKTIVSMGTFTPEYSRALEQAIRAADGAYVEAPVSGSRKPAEAGQLVAMLAGAPEAVSAASQVLGPMCSLIVPCGAVPLALTMKLAVNIFLITTVTGLAESAHFAKASGLDLRTLQTILDAGPMASSVSRIKLDKLVREDFTIQASIPDVLKNSQLITSQAREEAIATPLMAQCERLYAQTLALGLGDTDMAAVVRSLEAATHAIRNPAGAPIGNSASISSGLAAT